MPRWPASCREHCPARRVTPCRRLWSDSPATRRRTCASRPLSRWDSSRKWTVRRSGLPCGGASRTWTTRHARKAYAVSPYGGIPALRFPRDAGIQTEGDGSSIYGKKLVAFSTRVAGRPHSRWFLNIDSARHRSPEEDPDREEEASVALRLAHEINDRAPGVIAASFDTAWRGVHRTGLVRRGIIVFTRQHDGIKPHPLERFRYDDCTHDLYAAAGRACERQITVNGKSMYSPLPVRELEVRSGNTWRFYHRVEIPCRHGAHAERIPVYETQEDQRLDPRTKRKKFNRTEHLRQVPPNTDYGDRLLGFRQDSESGNCTLDYSHRDNRVPAYGAQAALLVCLGFTWMINSISLATAASPSA
ncbi:hypothetical protein [Streptomyces sp. H34-S4]|uniref:hypothetical protein n=1 Tax=Streptomyces sp. H34-S4 TaxID=2996463 RepID=UPI00226F4F8C|nr:hypothetical protein [Streptomyces sp. H34-S4]MCY0938563.1 hypothetical protein [Streptomyces sp. H34-S4]